MSWHQKILRTEAIFHALAAACVIKGLLVPSGEAMLWFGAAPGIAALGRSLPTEKVDEALSIPLTRPSTEDTPQ